jgi:hypothetical protein
VCWKVIYAGLHSSEVGSTREDDAAFGDARDKER